jgi:hypothetical protein
MLLISCTADRDLLDRKDAQRDNGMTCKLNCHSFTSPWPGPSSNRVLYQDSRTIFETLHFQLYRSSQPSKIQVLSHGDLLGHRGPQRLPPGFSRMAAHVSLFCPLRQRLKYVFTSQVVRHLVCCVEIQPARVPLLQIRRGSLKKLALLGG